MSVDFTKDTYEASLGACISLISGVMVCPLGEVYDLQDFLWGSSLMTHHRVSKPVLTLTVDKLAVYIPALAKVKPTEGVVKDVDTATAFVDGVASVVGWKTITLNYYHVQGRKDPAEAFENWYSNHEKGR